MGKITRAASSKHRYGVLLIVGSQIFAQQAPPVRISNELLSADASNYEEYRNGATADEMIAQHTHYDSENNAYVIAFHPNEERSLHGNQRREAVSLIRELTFNSDAVVLGTPVLRRSALTASHHFVFSDYEFRVDSIYVDRKKMIGGARSIIVSRAGGQTVLNGNSIRAIETDFPLFHLGEQYIFFLNRNDDSGSYSVRSSAAFHVEGETVESARSHPNHDQLPGIFRFEQIVHDAAAINPRGAR